MMGNISKGLMRLGEGIVIGVGAALAIGAFNAMDAARQELVTTREVFAVQYDVNDALTEEIARLSQEIDYLKRSRSSEYFENILQQSRDTIQGSSIPIPQVRQQDVTTLPSSIESLQNMIDQQRMIK